MMFHNKYIQVVIGSILGDGSLTPLSKKECCSCIDISQRVEKLAYLKWLFQVLQVGFPLNPIVQKKGFPRIFRFRSKPNFELGILRRTFYSSSTGKKIVPLNIKEIFISPIALATWYMDDGTLDKRDKYHFNSCLASYCFSFKECKMLKTTLRDNFGISVSVNRSTMRGKVYPRIYIRSESMNRFIGIIKPFIHSVYFYKLGL